MTRIKEKSVNHTIRHFGSRFKRKTKTEAFFLINID